MFANNSGRGNGNTHFVQFNAKTGLFTLTHKQQNAEGTLREHRADNGSISYKEEYRDMLNVMVRRVMVKQEPSYDDKNKMENKYKMSVRFEDGQDALITFSEGRFALRMLGLLNGADLSKMISMHGGAFAEGTDKKDLNTGEITKRTKPEPILYAKQGDKNVVAKYSDQENFQVPRVEEIKVPNPKTGEIIQTVWDTSARDAFTRELAAVVITKVEAAAKNQPAPSAAPAAAPANPADEDAASLSASDILGPDEDEGAAFRTGTQG